MFSSKPEIIELELSKKYKFMYENFLFSTQHNSYLMLRGNEGVVDVLKFKGSTTKYGSPNDEGRGAHPLTKYGALTYGFYEVKNSPWIKEQMVGNRCHPRHEDSMFVGKKHYIACFKDVMFEVTCRNYELVKLSKEELISLVLDETDNLDE